MGGSVLFRHEPWEFLEFLVLEIPRNSWNGNLYGTLVYFLYFCYMKNDKKLLWNVKTFGSSFYIYDFFMKNNIIFYFISLFSFFYFMLLFFFFFKIITLNGVKQNFILQNNLNDVLHVEDDDDVCFIIYMKYFSHHFFSFFIFKKFI